MCISKYMSLSFGLGVVHSHLRHFGDVIMAWIVLEPALLRIHCPSKGFIVLQTPGQHRTNTEAITAAMTHNYARSLVSELFAPFEPSKHKFWDKEVKWHPPSQQNAAANESHGD